MKAKICGITRPQEVQWINSAGADYAGFVLFFEKSKRNISIEEAKILIRDLDKRITPVAVTVKPTLEQIQEIEKIGFGMIQIHGDISEDVLSQIQIPVWKAFNVSDLSRFEFYEKASQIVGYVFDAQSPGSGKTFDWTLLSTLPKTEKQVMLAGGLTPQNVGKAIEKMWGMIDVVDTSSGVENENGAGKNEQKIYEFLEIVHGVR